MLSQSDAASQCESAKADFGQCRSAALAQGYLLFSTCTYAPQENEQVGQWFLKRFPELQGVTVQAMAEFQSLLSALPGYRLCPQPGLGAGAFAILFQRQEGSRQSLNEDFLVQSQFKLHQKGAATFSD